MRKLFKEKRRDAEEMNEEEIEEIDRLRRRFPNTMPNFLKGGNWMRDSPWWLGDERGIAIRRGIPSFHENIWSW